MSLEVRQGDVVWADPDPTRGSEQAKSRPFVIVSVDQMNAAPIEISIAVPLTRTDFGNPLHLRVDPPEGGLEAISFALPEQMRTLAHERIARRLGSLRESTRGELLTRCRLLISDQR